MRLVRTGQAQNTSSHGMGRGLSSDRASRQSGQRRGPFQQPGGRWGGPPDHHRRAPADQRRLLPAAFGVIVLQKAYAVTRAAVTPRLLPREISLVAANARTGMASLVSGTVGGLLALGISFIAGGGDNGAAWTLRAGTVVYLAA